jgi:hypothetical protein
MATNLNYRPIMSLFHDTDARVIEAMLAFYAPDAQTIIDTTCNTRRFWKGSTRTVICCDLDPAVQPDLVASWEALPFTDGSVDVLVFDPPHLPTDADSPNASKMYVKKFGATADRPLAVGSNVSRTFNGFLREAKRVLKNDGLVIAKIADLIHDHRYQWQHVDFILAAREHGLTPCDLIVNGHPSAGHLKSGRWQRASHARKSHVYFILLRNSNRCEPRRTDGR